MSRLHNNGWKMYRRNPSSTADARMALAIIFSSAVCAEVKISDNGFIFQAHFPKEYGFSPVKAPTLALLSARMCDAVPSDWWLGDRDIPMVNPVLLKRIERLTEANRIMAETQSRLVQMLHVGDKKMEE